MAIPYLHLSEEITARIYHASTSSNNQHILQMINNLDNRLHVAMINRFSSTRPFAFMNRDGAKT